MVEPNQEDKIMNVEDTGIGKYARLRTLGSGGNAKVKLVKDSTGNSYAMKLFTRLDSKYVKGEVDALTALSHPNIVNIIEYIDPAKYLKKSQKLYEGVAIVMELVPNGELFQYLAETGPFNEVTTRTYFHQLIEALDYCHNKKIVHRDLKVDNLLLDDKFNLKVADFGYATLFDKNPTGKLFTKLGTQGYKAPEIERDLPYDGKSVDIFASGVILFMMLSGHAPFEKPKLTDIWYKPIIQENYEVFWSNHGKRKAPGFYSLEFQNLVQSMLAYDPLKRITLSGIKEHAWYQGPVLTNETILAAFTERRRIIEERLRVQREAQERERELRQQHGNAMGGIERNFRSVPGKSKSGDEDPELQIQKEKEWCEKYRLDIPRVAKQYDKSGPFQPNTEIMVAEKTDVVFKRIGLLAARELLDLEFSREKPKVKGAYQGDVDRFEFTIEVLKVDDETSCISFRRHDGEALAFFNLITEKFRKPLE